MKYLIKIMVLLFGLSEALAQQEVTYNFLTRKFDSSFEKGYVTIPNKGFVDLYITNADTCKYEIEVNKKAVSYSYPQEGGKKEIAIEDLFSPCTVWLHYRFNSIESDELIVTIKAKDKKSKQSLPDVEFTIRTYGQWKLNISTGAIFNVGLSNENYEIQNNTIVNSGNKNDVVPLFPTVLTHAYRKSHSNFNWGASFGFGISDGDNVSFYAGPGFIFGENQRFILSGGAGIRKVKTLKSQYSENQVLTGTIPDVSSLTSDPYKLGGFFAITYNLTSKTQ